MTVSPRGVGALVVAGLTAGLMATSAMAQAPTSTPAPPPSGAPSVAKAPAWPQAASDLAPDPAVRFGVLPNGMRYAIMRNNTPASAVSIRLRIGSGSLEEAEDEQGLAHVLEHMAFRGSRNVPAGDMIKILERDGLAFGPDTNAETEWTQTVYQLDIPHTSPEVLATGLMLMRETAGNLLLDPKALDTERGVVLSEERLRDTPNYRALKAQIELFLDGQLAARRFPIGKTEIIRHAPASLLRAFYDANYRPDRATLVVVGDVDPGAVEAKIRALFGDWRGQGPETPAPDLGAPAARGLTVAEVRLPGASTSVMLGWARPFDASPDTRAKEIRETVENLGLAVLNRRLSELAHSANPPFLNASAGTQNLFDSARITVLEADSTPSAWSEALAASEREVRRILAYGVTEAELRREIADMRSTLQTAVAGASTRLTSSLADDLVRTVDDNEVFTPPSEDLATFDAAVADLTPKAVDAALARLFTGAGPLVDVATPDPIAGGESAVKAAFTAAASAPLTAPAAQTAVTWPYDHFGTPGAVVQRRDIADLGVTEATFANGVRLTVKPTPFRKDQILVAVNVGEGRAGLPRTGPNRTWLAAALIPGGLGRLSYDDVQRALAGKVFDLSFSVEDRAFAFKGSTRPADLDTEMQLVAAYMSDPGYGAPAFEQARTGLLSDLPQLDATPDGVFARRSGDLLSRGDARFSFPTREALEAATPNDLRAMTAQALAHGPVEVTLVGDLSVDQAIAAVSRTLGALPAREAGKIPPDADEVRFPEPTATPITLIDSGRPDQAIAAIAWPMTGFFSDMQASRADMLAGEVLQNRLIDKIRIAEGKTYSPQTEVDLSQSFPTYGFALAEVEVPPAEIPGFFASVKSIAADMADHGVSADELERARNPRLAGIKRAQLTNDYWLLDLEGAQADPRRLDLIRSTLPDYAAVTTSDIQNAARRWLSAGRAFELEIHAPAPPSPRPASP